VLPEKPEARLSDRIRTDNACQHTSLPRPLALKPGFGAASELASYLHQPPPAFLLALVCPTALEGAREVFSEYFS